jgi:hypothetical protein
MDNKAYVIKLGSEITHIQETDSGMKVNTGVINKDIIFSIDQMTKYDPIDKRYTFVIGRDKFFAKQEFVTQLQ